MASILSRYTRGRHSTGIWVLLVAFVSFFLAGLFNLYAGIGAGIAGGLIWWALIEQPAKPTLLRGGVFGFLTVLLAHPLMWLIGGFLGDPVFTGFLFSNVSGQVTSLSELTDVIRAVAAFTFLSLLTGFLTLPIGIGAGLGLVVFRRSFPRESETQPTEIGDTP